MSIFSQTNRFEAYLKKGKNRIYDKNEYIYRENEASRRMYFILQGKIRIGNYAEKGDEILKYIIEKGHFFGEKSILRISTRTEFAKADSTVELISFSTNEIVEMMKNEQVIKQEVYDIIYNRFSRLEKRLHILRYNDIRTRLWLIFEELEKHHISYCDIETKALIIEHPYKQNDLANLIRTSRTRLNTAMKSLKDLELIQYKNYKIEIQSTQ